MSFVIIAIKVNLHCIIEFKNLTNGVGYALSVEILKIFFIEIKNDDDLEILLFCHLL